MFDEPFAVADWVGRHHEACPRCQQRLAEIAGNADYSRALLSQAAPATDASRAYQRFRASVSSPAAQPAGAAPRLLERMRMGLPARRPATALALAAVAAVGISATAVAEPRWMQIVEPSHVQPVTVTQAELQGLPDLSQFGTMTRGPQTDMTPVASLSAAGAATGLTPVKAASLPANVPNHVTYEVVTPSWAAFTFNAKAAAAAAAKQHRAYRPMPANIDGSTLRVDYGPAIAQMYGAPANGTQGIPTLVVVQMKTPHVTSSGVTVKQLEDYLLSQPGVSPQLAAQIRAIGDPATTLPIPILLGSRINEQPVQVHGVAGALFGDSTGLGAGVLWINKGQLFAVAGTVSQNEVLQVANSLS
jgi:hypothetical protein